VLLVVDDLVTVFIGMLVS